MDRLSAWPPARMLPVFAALALAVAGCSAAEPVATGDTIVHVLRHAEKADDGRDPVLSASGNARAQALAGRWAGERIDAIYVTPLQRTRLTALPLARAAGLEPQPLWDGTADTGTAARRLADHILARHRGGRVVVVGHSNTIPAIVHALSGQQVSDIDESRYDDLFTVTVGADGQAELDWRQQGFRAQTDR